MNEFNLYVAAVKLAHMESKGSGELNHFDHVAKDLHEPDFDELYEKMTSDEISQCVRQNHEEIVQLSKKYIRTNSDKVVLQ